MGVLLHAQTAFWFVAGPLGRNMTMARARTVSDVRTLDELVTLSGRFERMMVIPGSLAVIVAGLLAAWALGEPLAGADNWWVLLTLLLFVAIGVLVPTVFLPHGKVFEHALAEAKAPGGHAGFANGAAGSGRSQRPGRGARRRRGDHHADGHQALLIAIVSRAPRRPARPTR